MKATLYLLILAAMQFSCNSPDKAKSSQRVKYLHVTADIPDDLLVEVRNNFRSIPTCWGCKSISEQSWNWVPLEYSNTYYISREDREICVPLFINKATVCKWIYYNSEIGINRIDSFGINGFLIYPTADTTLTLKYAELVDTMRYDCYQWINQYTNPNKIYTDCDQLG